MFIDGTKLESRAGRYTFCWRGSVEKHLAKVRGAVLEQTGLTSAQELRQYLTVQAKQLRFVYGSGKRKSEEQRTWETLSALCERLEGYEASLAMMGADRNSYSKTDLKNDRIGKLKLNEAE